MPDSLPVNSAVDAVCLLYLACVAEREGRADAARRWQEIAARWLNRLEPGKSFRAPLPTPKFTDGREEARAGSHTRAGT